MDWSILAVWRFILALIVFFSHYDFYVKKTWITGFIGNFSAFVAVLSFFFVSGYSIAHSYFKSPKGFYKRRFKRIYLTYLVCFIISLVVFSIKEPFYIFTNGIDVIGSLFFLQTFVTHQVEFNISAWSLAIEIFFYILTPLFAILSNRLLIFCIVASQIGYIMVQFITPEHPSTMMNGTAAFYLLWAWLIGFWYYKNQENKNALIYCVIGGIMPLVFNNSFTAQYGVLIWVLGCVLVTAKPILSSSCKKLFTFLGDLSYPFYLSHFSVLILITVMKIDSIILGLLLSLVLSFLLLFINNKVNHHKFR